METLIRFWREKIKEHHWLMSNTDLAMVQETIKALRELRRIRVENRVQREADIVRTVKQLSEQGKKSEPVPAPKGEKGNSQGDL